MNVLLQKEYIAGFKVIDGQNNKKTTQELQLKYDDKIKIQQLTKNAQISKTRKKSFINEASEM